MKGILPFILILFFMNPEIITALVASIPSLLTAGAALYIAFRKTPTEIKKNNSESQKADAESRKADAESRKADAESHKADAEADNLHAQVADRWAEHVVELQGEVKGLRLDINQVRRENEMYRSELKERDLIIADLKDWAERLITQLSVHAPHVKPEEYYRKSVIGDDTLRRLRKKNSGDV